LAAIWTLLLFNLRNEDREANNPSSPRRPHPARLSPRAAEAAGTGPITSQFFWATNGIAIGAFGLTLVIFFAIPRIGAGFFQKNRLDLIRTSGFSEKVDLSAIGAIKLDQTVVMRVEFPDGPRPVGELLYFRGGAYDAYDGRSWSNTLSQRRAVLRGPDGTFYAAERPSRPQPTVSQDILLEPLDTAALFGVSTVDRIRSTSLVIQSDAMGNLYLPYPPSTRLQYSVQSTLHPIRAEERLGTAFVYPAEIRRRFLQLPALSPRVGDLAVQVTNASATLFEKVMALERHLKSNYRYSLDVGAGLGRQVGNVQANPIEDFLFTRKTGYCEHYASAMVMMLRSLGIPARLVTGFLPGEWNDFGNYYTVRQRDAHAWVEVYFPSSGWVTFDPTPPDTQPTGSRLFLQMGRMIDSIRLKWDRLVIQYSFRDQLALAQGIRERGEQVRSQVGDWMLVARQRIQAGQRWLAELGQSPAAVVAVGVVGAGLMAALAILLWRRWRWTPGPNTGRSETNYTMVRLYVRMLRLLRRRGLEKAPAATPLQFARVVRGEWFAAYQFVQPLTDLYCRVRFGRSPLTPEDLRQADALLRGLRAVKRTPTPSARRHAR
jgi:transglutaminase-like putative cysteine protease